MPMPPFHRRLIIARPAARLLTAFLAKACGLAIVLSPTGAYSQFSLDELLETGQQLWEEHAPEELQEEYRLPTAEEINEFLSTVDTALAEGDPQSLAAYAPGARIALEALRHFEGGDAVAAWLEPRLDYLEASEQMQESAPPPQPPTPTPPPTRPSDPPPPQPKPPTPAPAAQFTQPYWDAAIASRPRPKQADLYLSVFKKSFQTQGVPPALAWLSEVESSFNINAKSPVGAYGPFQFMPATAERFGLRTGRPDDRAHPQKSSEAAASYLKILYKQFQSWPYALAAYNAGEGRVGRALKSSGAASWAELSPHLPAETRMYVPKVLATIAAREGIDPNSLPGI